MKYAEIYAAVAELDDSERNKLFTILNEMPKRNKAEEMTYLHLTMLRQVDLDSNRGAK